MGNALQIININSKGIHVKEFKGQRVVTFKDIDTVHQRPEGTAKRNFNENKSKFIENEDYFILKPADIQRYEIRTFEASNRGLTILTESGYLMLVKSFSDDLAWKVQRQLVNTYFKIKLDTYTLKPTDDKAKLTEAKLINAKVRLSNQFLKLSKVDTLSKEYKNILVSKATEILTGEKLIALPESKQKTYSATELGEMFGISSNKIGRLTNKYNLKTAEYGEYYRDKSQHSSKEVDAFRYYDSVIPELEKILEVKSKIS